MPYAPPERSGERFGAVARLSQSEARRLLRYRHGTGADNSVDLSPDRFSERLPAYAANVATLRRGVARFAEAHGAGELISADIALAVGEALNNVVIHAYREQSVPGAMAVDAHVEHDRLAVAVTDDGYGPGPRVDSPGLGLGLPVMASLSSTMSVGLHSACDQPGTVVVLNFALA
jgi:anti-sigma regulatory factor (Ser/Thr protein kinase)